ncbi:hypothetical protein M1K46_19575 [Fictibacillus sp. WQ 8-8]|uniref:hypothetical protein n=1 Tax=Fictibacillus sp. WQ 8-8 TaxID=2938788 RepID=UPI00210CFC99|nr:hypothetical protein [Fictibacillus sp. WQ 8-8]MCQ6267831.1 hypothetical protein [Fictibacillus sp. WQ 8-8]
MKKFRNRLMVWIVTLLVLQLIVINIAGLLPFIAEQKSQLSTEAFLNFILQNIQHPILQSTQMIQEKSPLFLLGSGSVIILSFYIAFISNRRKTQYELADKYGVHGSSRFALPSEIFTHGETLGVAPQQLMKDLEASMIDHRKE